MKVKIRIDTIPTWRPLRRGRFFVGVGLAQVWAGRAAVLSAACVLAAFTNNWVHQQLFILQRFRTTKGRSVQ
jgi:hypothetical protein